MKQECLFFTGNLTGQLQKLALSKANSPKGKVVVISNITIANRKLSQWLNKVIIIIELLGTKSGLVYVFYAQTYKASAISPNRISEVGWLLTR